MLLIILFTLLVAAAAVVLYQAWLIRRQNLEYEMLDEDYRESLDINQRLRETNRDASTAWGNERRRLSSQVHDAERHAQGLQHFHLTNQHELERELAGAHGVIELLLMSLPKADLVTHTFEVQRIFRPIVQMTRSANTTHDIHVF